MPKVNNTSIFGYDKRITPKDYFFGTDGDSNKKNKSFSAIDVAAFVQSVITGNGESPVVPLNFMYTKSIFDNGTFFSNVDFVKDLQTFDLSIENIEKYNLIPFLNFIKNNSAKFFINITITNVPNTSAYFNINNITELKNQDDEVKGYRFEVSLIDELYIDTDLIEGTHYNILFHYKGLKTGLLDQPKIQLTAGQPFEYVLPDKSMLFAIDITGNGYVKIGTASGLDDLGDGEESLIQLGLTKNASVFIESDTDITIEPIIFQKSQ